MKTKLLFLVILLASLFVQSQGHDDYWVEQNTNFSSPYQGIRNISIVNDNIVWAVAYNATDDGVNTQEFTRTTDGGMLWTSGTIDIGSPSSGIAMIHAVSIDMAYIIVYPNLEGDAQGVYITIDAGLTWTRQDAFNNSDSYANVVYFWDEFNGFAQGNPVDGSFELYTTSDGGTEWSRVPIVNVPEPLSGETGYVNYIYSAGESVWFTTNKGRLYKTSDHGFSWIAYQAPISDFFGCEVSFSDDNNGYLTNQDGDFWRTSDGGENWEFVTNGGVIPGNICAIANTNALVVAGAGSVMGTAYSLDRGDTFTIMCDDDQHLDTQFINGTIGWSGSFTNASSLGGIYKYENPCCEDIFPYPWSINELADKGFIAYPNPVIDNYQMSATDRISSVTVSDIQGQMLYRAKPNTLTHNIDMCRFPNGVYIVSVKIGTTNGSLRIVK